VAISYNSNYDVTIPFSDVSLQIALATATEQTYTVPGTATVQYSARFSYTQNSNVFVRLNGTVVTPGAGTKTTLQYDEFKPGSDGSQRYVKGGDVLHFITPDASAYVGMSLRQLS
jgi:hypothetical protein